MVPALPGLLVFGRDVAEVLERVRAAIAFHIGRGPLPIQLAVSRQNRGELFTDPPGLSGGNVICSRESLSAIVLDSRRPSKIRWTVRAPGGRLIGEYGGRGRLWERILR